VVRTLLDGAVLCDVLLDFGELTSHGFLHICFDDQQLPLPHAQVFTFALEHVDLLSQCIVRFEQLLLPLPETQLSLHDCLFTFLDLGSQ